MTPSHMATSFFIAIQIKIKGWFFKYKDNKIKNKNKYKNKNDIQIQKIHNILIHVFTVYNTPPPPKNPSKSWVGGGAPNQFFADENMHNS
jgi:hypothetical protein